MELVYDTATTGNQYVGMRFANLGIPQGATITTASNNISSRPTTTASVSWTPAAWNTVGSAGADQRTPDLKDIVQEIVNRSGWSANNGLAIIITGTGERTAEAYEGSASQPSSAAGRNLRVTVSKACRPAEGGIASADFFSSPSLIATSPLYKSSTPLSAR